MPRLVEIKTCFFWDNSLYVEFHSENSFKVTKNTYLSEMSRKFIKKYFLMSANNVNFTYY